MKVVALILGVSGLLALAGCGGDSEASTVASFSLTPMPAVPQGPRTDELIVNDVVAGSGMEVETGDRLFVHYLAGNYETGEKSESGWVKGEPFVFNLGGGSMIDSWEEGLPGMRVGGRRELIFPATPTDSALGSRPGDTLVYIVDLIKAKDLAGKGAG